MDLRDYAKQKAQEEAGVTALQQAGMDIVVHAYNFRKDASLDPPFDGTALDSMCAGIIILMKETEFETGEEAARFIRNAVVTYMGEQIHDGPANDELDFSKDA